MDHRVSTLVLLAALLSGSLAVYGTGAPFAGAQAADIVAKKTAESIVVDAVAAEELWAKVPGVDIPLSASAEGGGHIAKVTIKAAHDGKQIFILAIWADPTEDRVWHTPEQYPQGPFEDRVALMFSIGPVDMAFPCMKLGTNGAVTAGKVDLWHWHGARDDSDGKNFTTTKPPPKGFWYHPYPVADDQYANTTARYDDKKLGGSRDDVRAKGRWSAGVWTVEMVRSLTAPDPNFDAALGVGTTIQVSFAVYDGGKAETEAVKSTSPWKILQVSSESITAADYTLYYVAGGIVAIVAIAAGTYALKVRGRKPSPTV